MLKPDFRSTSFNKACYHFDAFLDRPFLKHLLRPFMVTSCSLAIVIISKPGLQDSLNFLSQETLVFIKNYNLIGLISLTFILAIASIFRDCIKEWGQPKSSLNRNDIVSLLDSFGQIVENKSQRFLASTKLCFEKKWTPEKVFKEITVPEQQLMLLTKGVQGVFETLFNNEINFRVGLLRIEDDNPSHWQAFYPTDAPPRTSITELSKPESTIKSALQAQDLFIIEDIQKELGKTGKDCHFIRGSTNRFKKGSIAAYPIYCPNTCNAIYVLSILASKKCLTNKDRDLYEWILQHFKQRIILEHHLLIMKQVSHEKK